MIAELKRIVLAEDNANDVELTLAALRENHVVNEITVVRDGAAALDYLYRRNGYASRPGGNPALLLLDLKMPKVDGIEVLRQVKSDPALRTIPVVVLTSSREEQDLVRTYERKKMDDALKMARMEAERANRAKSDFLSRMSHDLRTPLNAILGFAQLLEAEVTTANAQDSIAQIVQGGKHLLVLINEVLDIARIEAGHLSLSIEPVDARETVRLVANLVRPLADQRRIRVMIDEPGTGDVFVQADRQRLNRVLMNLLSNAVKYNRVGGLVTVGFETVDGRTRITVADTGAGLPPAKLAMLFQPFERLGAEQTSVEGTGLGLALSRGLAEAMGGTLGVTSAVDGGSKFWIELAPTEPPHVIVEAQPEARPVDSLAPPTTTGVVLYVEDNHSNVRLMERVLQRRPGVRLLHAPIGTDGVAMARQHRPNLILLDLHLPDMPGEEVLQRLSRDPELRDIPVAVLSADAMPSHPRRLKGAGAIAYLTKPLEITLVLKLVDETLNLPRLLARGANLND